MEWCEPDAQKALTLLVTGDEAGTLILSVNGLFPIVHLKIQGPAAAAVACCASGDLQNLLMWVQTVDGPKLESYQLGFLTKEFEVFSTVTAYLNILMLLQAAKAARSAAFEAWREALSPLDRKLEIYDKELQDWYAGEGPMPTAKSELLALVKHGAAGSTTTRFLEGHLAEPSLSRMHKVVETATNEAEAALRDHLLVSARLLCYHAGELLASSRVCCQFEPNEAGLDVRLCRRLVDEAENLVLSTECVILHVRRARAALAQLFKWLKDLHTADSTDKKS